MIYVTMKDGRTLRYNYCNFYYLEDDYFRLETNSTGDDHIARIDRSLVERVECMKPCAIHDKNGKQVKIKY